MKRTSLMISLAIAACIRLMATAFTSCKKSTGPSTALVRILDTNGRTIVGATVRVFCTEALCVVDDTAFSDANGESEHEFELPAVLKIQSWKQISTRFQLNDSTSVDTFYTLYGEGWIRLEENDRVVQELTLFGSNLQ